MSMVAPIVDYASPIFSQHPTKTEKMANQIQRIAVTTIITDFKTIVLPITEVEAAIDMVQDRWTKKARQRQQSWLRTCGWGQLSLWTR